MPVINGKELNNEPDQTSVRSIINFQGWKRDEAAEYTEVFEIVEREVRPVRAQNKRALYRDQWWIHAERRPGLYKSMRDLPRCFATGRVTKHMNYSAMPTSVRLTACVAREPAVAGRPLSGCS